MSELLPNYLSGRWQSGRGDGVTLRDPVLGDELVRVSAEGLNFTEGFAFARERGAALRAMSYGERAGLLAKIGELLQSKRDDYYAIATANSGGRSGREAYTPILLSSVEPDSPKMNDMPYSITADDNTPKR